VFEVDKRRDPYDESSAPMLQGQMGFGSRSGFNDHALPRASR